MPRRKHRGRSGGAREKSAKNARRWERKEAPLPFMGDGEVLEVAFGYGTTIHRFALAGLDTVPRQANAPGGATEGVLRTWFGGPDGPQRTE